MRITATPVVVRFDPTRRAPSSRPGASIREARALTAREIAHRRRMLAHLASRKPAAGN